MKHSQPIGLLLLFLITAFYTGGATPANLTNSAIQDCLTNELGFRCKQKRNIGLSASYGIQVDLEIVSTTTIQQDGEPVSLEETTQISVVKDRPKLVYPLRHLHTVPYLPHAQSIEIQLSSVASSSSQTTCAEFADATGVPGECIDSPDAAAPTCGWTYQGSLKIPHSQGACNGNTAHCLRQGELYYHGYEIGPYRESFSITHQLRRGNLTHDFTLTPQAPFYAVDQPGGFRLQAELMGNDAAYRGAPDLSNYILYIPAAPSNHAYVQDYQHNMLLVPREEVSVNGSECNRVGVSFQTFRDWAGSHDPSSDAGCLNNQLFHKHNADLHKLIQNPDAETTYLLHGKRWFKRSMTFHQGMPQILMYAVDDINPSQVVLSMDADEVKEVNTESLGIIMEASVKSFTSMSEEGNLRVQIQNYGDLKTSYVTSVTQCNMAIDDAIPAQARMLEPAETTVLYFDLNTRYNMDTSNECLVSLASPTGRLYDEVLAKFDTFKHVSDYPWMLEQTNDDTRHECWVQLIALEGDFNSDGCVDRSDYYALLGEIRAGTNSATYDLNGDGLVDVADAQALIGLFSNPNGLPCGS